MASVVFLVRWEHVHEAGVSYDTLQEYKRWINKFHRTVVSKEFNIHLATYRYGKCVDRLDRINKTLRELHNGRSK